MPIFFQHSVDDHTKLAIWHIKEEESFFLNHVPLHRNITHPHKRLQHLAGRYLLRYLFPDFPTSLIRIADTRKPFLEDEAYHFSISHCGDYAAVIASSKSRVGIDIEIPTEKVMKIVHKFLHKDEYVLLGGFENITVPATILWSAKEAMFKWWGNGKVDFSEMLRLKGRLNEEKGTLDARFLKEEWQVSFPVQYHYFDHMVLAWAQTDTTSDPVPQGPKL